tara:strand:- start:960 stop:1985 length:1026 start_codon:yes stop_codon:yes gene_type:complete
MDFQGFKIGIAKIDDLSSIMKFISHEWSSDHILSQDKDFFLYQYGNKENLNFIVAKDGLGSISATLGFIPSSADKKSQIFTTMWKVSKNSPSATLGLKLFSYLQDLNLGPLMSVGINEKTEEIYKFLRLHVGSLDQYFIVNRNLHKFQMAKFSKKILQDTQKTGYKSDRIAGFIEPKTLEKFLFYDNSSKKDYSFVKRRYCSHPYFDYKFLGVFDNTNMVSSMVLREVCYKNSRALRIIDYFGEECFLADFTMFLKQLMTNTPYEYIDFFCYGFQEQNLLNAGFNKVSDSDLITVIPDHFDPFIKEKYIIKFFAPKDMVNGLKVFKGDGDQDCPRRPQDLS